MCRPIARSIAPERAIRPPVVRLPADGGPLAVSSRTAARSAARPNTATRLEYGTLAPTSEPPDNAGAYSVSTASERLGRRPETAQLRAGEWNPRCRIRVLAKITVPR